MVLFFASIGYMLYERIQLKTRMLSDDKFQEKRISAYTLVRVYSIKEAHKIDSFVHQNGRLVCIAIICTQQ